MKNMTEKERQEVCKKAFQNFGAGFHCAETVATAALAAMGEDPSEATAHATAFGGGFGRTRLEACGALSGALIAIGHLYGRRSPGGPWDRPARLGAEIHRRFLEEYGTTRCETLCDHFGKENQAAECKELTKAVTAKLLAILAASPEE